MAALGQHLEGMPHHGGAGDLAEGADMRQAGGAVAGLEQHLAIAAALVDAGDELSRLLEGPGGGGCGGRDEIGRKGLGHDSLQTRR